MQTIQTVGHITGDAGYRTIGDESAVLNGAERVITTTAALTAARTLTLALSTGIPAGSKVEVSDVFGGVSAAFPLTIALTSPDQMNGSTAALVLALPYVSVTLKTDGAGHWSVIGMSSVAPGSVANFRNLLDGGDFTVNPFQRNIAGLAASNAIASAISNTPTYFADRWFGVGGASSAILFTKAADAGIPGFSTSLKLSRQAGNTNTAPINMGQVIESADAVRCQGQQLTLSFWAKKGANYSGGNLGVSLYSGTGSNDTAANMVAGAWAGSATAINASQALTTGYVRYQFTGTVPAAATQLGVLFSFTPSGTAGADDSVSFSGLQLEIGNSASPFEHRDIQVETEICQRYAWITAEPASGVVVGIGGAVAAANAQVFYLATPVQMIKAPAVTVAAGSFKVAAAAAAATATGIAAGTTHTPNAISITTTVTETVGLAAALQGGGGSGYIVASADF